MKHHTAEEQFPWLNNIAVTTEIISVDVEGVGEMRYGHKLMC
jgi:hypothetical protein